MAGLGGQRIAGGRYEIEAGLATGGFKTVWRAFDHRLGHPVALAVLHDHGEAGELRTAFERETRALSVLTTDLPAHVAGFRERVVTLTDVGTLEDEPPFQGFYIATRLVQGRELRELRSEAPLPWRRAAKIAIGILEALELSHTPTPHRGPILHRDIKPSNIILGDDDAVTVLDFGVAKLAQSTRTDVSQVVGTLQYMAPEQLEEGEIIGVGVDLFPVGVILHELLTGKPPWPRSSLGSAIAFYAEVKRGHVPPLRDLDALLLPADLGFVLRSALAVQPQGRPASARDMRVALETLVYQPEVDDLSTAPGVKRPEEETRTVAVAPAFTEPSVTLRTDGAGDADTLRTLPDPLAGRGKPRSKTRRLLVALLALAIAPVFWVLGTRFAPPSTIASEDPVPRPPTAPAVATTTKAPARTEKTARAALTVGPTDAGPADVGPPLTPAATLVAIDTSEPAAVDAESPDAAAAATPPDAGPTPAELAEAAERAILLQQPDQAYALLTACLAAEPGHRRCEQTNQILFASGWRPPREVTDAGHRAAEPAFEAALLDNPPDEAPPPRPSPARATPAPSPEEAADAIGIFISSTDEDAAYLGMSRELRRALDACVSVNRAEARYRPETIRIGILLHHEGFALRTAVSPNAWRTTKTAICIEHEISRWRFPEFAGVPRNASFEIRLGAARK